MRKTIDLHSHTLFSDGALIPAEHVRRAIVAGYEAIGITDHADFTNYKFILKNVNKIKTIEEDWDIQILAGIEITHVPPNRIHELAKKAKKAGADIVVVHGETIIEPVAQGTNLAAVKSKYVDILAHPGFLTESEAVIAKENDVHIEITARNGHNKTNGHVAKVASSVGAKIVCNTDAHNPSNFISSSTAMKVLKGSGLTERQALQSFKNSERLVRKCFEIR